MRIILAISGGVDSMVMLHMAQKSRAYTQDELVVAHFDHGIRDNSAEDAEFVQRKAEEYGIECRIGRGNLGARTSEAEARKLRYEFLYTVAGEQGQKTEIWTAHHLDDLIESVVINFMRGTGWRGLAALDRNDIRRPLLDLDMVMEPMDKVAIFRYAAENEIEYREDQSNSWDEYLRNRIRHQTNNSNEFSYEQKLELYRLWRRQKLIKSEVERLTEWLATQLVVSDDSTIWKREWFREINEEAALELLRYATQKVGIKATRPQLRNFREAILNYKPGKCFNLPEGRLVKIGKKVFEL